MALLFLTLNTISSFYSADEMRQKLKDHVLPLLTVVKKCCSLLDEDYTQRVKKAN
jgi:hypothetical protein